MQKNSITMTRPEAPPQNHMQNMEVENVKLTCRTLKGFIHKHSHGYKYRARVAFKQYL